MNMNLQRTSLLFFVSLLAFACGSSFAHSPNDGLEIVAESSAENESGLPVEQQPRRQLFWSLVFLADLLKNPPCPPIGPLHDRCKEKKDAASSNGGDSSTSVSANTSSESSSAQDNTPSSLGGIPAGARTFKIWMFVAAAVAVAMAIAAVVAGQRRQEKKPHILHGSVVRRMGLFQNFCDSSLLCNSEARPSRVVEMTMSMDDYDNINSTTQHSAMV